MMNTLLRTARSAILNTARDFSCCILTADDEMLAMAESLPIHVMSGPDLIARVHEADAPDAPRGRRLPPQLAVPRQLPRRRLVRRHPRHRRRRRPPLHRPRQGAPGRLRQRVPTTYVADATGRLQRGRADLPLRQGAGGLPGPRRRHPHGPRAHPRPRPLVRRLPRAARRRPDRRTPPARARRRDGLRIAQDATSETGSTTASNG